MFRNEARKEAISPAPSRPTLPSLPLFSISLSLSPSPNPAPPLSPFSLDFSYLYLLFSIYFFPYLSVQTAMHHPQPHIPTSHSAAAAAAFDFKSAKRRGSYNCGRCGLPKKGHVCQISSSNTTTTPTSSATPTSATAVTSSSAPRSPLPPPPRQSYPHLRRALSFDDFDNRCESPELKSYDSPLPCTDLDPDDEIVSGGLTVGCLWEVLRRLPPSGLFAAARVCKGWRKTTKRLWRAAEELKLMVPSKAQLRFIGSLLQKCPSLVRLSLKMERFGSTLVSDRKKSFIDWIH